MHQSSISSPHTQTQKDFGSIFLVFFKINTTPVINYIFINNFFILSIGNYCFSKNVQYKILSMTGFESQTSGIGSNCSTNWATTTALFASSWPLQILCVFCCLPITRAVLFISLIRALDCYRMIVLSLSLKNTHPVWPGVGVKNVQYKFLSMTVSKSCLFTEIFYSSFYWNWSISK